MILFGLMSGEVTGSGHDFCVRQFKADGSRDDLFAGTPDTFFIRYLLAQAASPRC